MNAEPAIWQWTICRRGPVVADVTSLKEILLCHQVIELGCDSCDNATNDPLMLGLRKSVGAEQMSSSRSGYNAVPLTRGLSNLVAGDSKEWPHIAGIAAACFRLVDPLKPSQHDQMGCRNCRVVRRKVRGVPDEQARCG